MKRLPAEWEKQKILLITFPHKKTDWNRYLKEIRKSYVEIIKTIAKFQKVLILSDNKKRVKSYFKKRKNLKFVEIKSNDTWIRDYGFITLLGEKRKYLYNFKFNGWGDKFSSSLDNKINRKLYKKGLFKKYKLINRNFILEGGSIDTNGKGVLLTTEECLLNKNRNNLSKREIAKKLKKFFNLKKIIWLKNGHLIGDDTDAHIDTIARFIDEKTIAYVKCYDKNDPHFKSLSKMEKELKKREFNLLPLPLPSPKFYDGERLPATYLNFLFINGALILPIYNDIYDEVAIKRLKKFFKNRKKIVTIDASILIREHGSLHCATIGIF